MRSNSGLGHALRGQSPASECGALWKACCVRSSAKTAGNWRKRQAKRRVSSGSGNEPLAVERGGHDPPADGVADQQRGAKDEGEAEQRSITWQFATDQARERLHRHCPDLEIKLNRVPGRHRLCLPRHQAVSVSGGRT